MEQLSEPPLLNMFEIQKRNIFWKYFVTAPRVFSMGTAQEIAQKRLVLVSSLAKMDVHLHWSKYIIHIIRYIYIYTHTYT